jgi:hypothetical protein
MQGNRIETAIIAVSQSERIKMSNDTQTKAQPSHRLCSVTDNGKGKPSTWTEIGAAWSNADGKGFNLEFAALPLPGAKLVLREPKAKAEGAEAA